MKSGTPAGRQAQRPVCVTVQPALEERSGLPPALLREKGEAYGRKLMQVGVPVTSTRYDGTIHDFAMQNALADAWDAKSAICQATDTGGRHMPVQPSQ